MADIATTGLHTNPLIQQVNLGGTVYDIHD
jgi:hypothetical protein